MFFYLPHFVVSSLLTLKKVVTFLQVSPEYGPFSLRGLGEKTSHFFAKSFFWESPPGTVLHGGTSCNPVTQCHGHRGIFRPRPLDLVPGPIISHFARSSRRELTSSPRHELATALQARCELAYGPGYLAYSSSPYCELASVRARFITSSSYHKLPSRTASSPRCELASARVG